jgi:hypothetical protein
VTHSKVNGSQTCPAPHAEAACCESVPANGNTFASFEQETPVGVEQMGGLIGGQNSVAAQGPGGPGGGGGGGVGVGFGHPMVAVIKSDPFLAMAQSIRLPGCLQCLDANYSANR